MGWRIYGEPEPRESPVCEFFAGLFFGMLGLYCGGEWVLVSLIWVSPGVMLALCVGSGLLLGCWLAYCSVRRKSNRSK